MCRPRSSWVSTCTGKGKIRAIAPRGNPRAGVLRPIPIECSNSHSEPLLGSPYMDAADTSPKFFSCLLILTFTTGMSYSPPPPLLYLQKSRRIPISQGPRAPPIGVVDGTKLMVTPPRDHRASFRSCKGLLQQNLLASVSFDLRLVCLLS